uniref:Protein kinase domain-containing protein n=1 Tax=Panagrellus redivivus TaxID=6233 RepID=A0A7E4ZXA8_PANRE
MVCADDLEAAEIAVGQILTTSKKRYLIVEELGRGGYGCVFKVQPQPADGTEYALKLEKRREGRDHAKLAMEMNIMKLVGNLKPAQRTHFIDVYDRAKKDKFFFIVMTLVGESLQDLKRQRKPPVFSAATAHNVGLQCLQAIEHLHAIGFIHRDIKPEVPLNQFLGF